MKIEKQFVDIKTLKRMAENGVLQSGFIYGSITESTNGIKGVHGLRTINGEFAPTVYFKSAIIRFVYDDGSTVMKSFNELVEEGLYDIVKDETVEISKNLYDELNRIGLIPSETNRANVGASDYAKNLIQPWVIFNAHPNLNYQECDVIKRILRTKEGDSRLLDLEKIKHIVDELIRQEKLKD